MFNKKLVMCVLFIFTLIGCGGGGGGDSTPPPTIPDDPIDDPVNDLPEKATVEMSELKASDDFDFTSKQKIEVALDLTTLLASNGHAGLRAYVSVYSDYTLLDSGQYYANASSRVLGGDLLDGKFASSFTSLNAQDTYLLEVWFYTGESPLQREQSIVDGTLSW